MSMTASLALTLLLILPLAASPIIYLAGRLPTITQWLPSTSGQRRGANKFALYFSHHTAPGNRNSIQPAKWVAFTVMLGMAVLLWFAGKAYVSGEGVELAYGSIALRLDGISLVLAMVAIGLGLLVILFSTSYMAGEVGEEKFYALLTAMIGSIIGLGCAQDLFNLWVWFEAMAISSYLLVAFYRQQPASLEAGFKYLVQSAAGSVLVLLGIALVFAQTGTLNLAEIATATLPGSIGSIATYNQAAGSAPLLLAAGALLLIGFGVKTALVPLHTWLPDAHSQAPSGISAMLSGVVIEAGMVALLRSLGSLPMSSSAWGTLLLGFGALNMIVGNLMALRQTQVKRLLAYSSVSHMGYMLFGFGLAVAFNQAGGAAGGFFHLVTHALMKGLAFLAAGSLLYALYLAKGSHNVLVIDDLNGISKRYPLAAFAFGVAVLGLGGLPPLAGFMSKWQIFVAGFEAKNVTAMLLIIFMALNSVLSLGYYAPLVNRMYRHKPSPVAENGKPIPLIMSIPLLLLSMGVVVLGCAPMLMNWLTAPAAADFMKLFVQ